jgi:hypothetical protein
MSYSAESPNNRVEFARVARPTRKQLRRLLAAHAGRWVAIRGRTRCRSCGHWVVATCGDLAWCHPSRASRIRGCCGIPTTTCSAIRRVALQCHSSRSVLCTNNHFMRRHRLPPHRTRASFKLGAFLKLLSPPNNALQPIAAKTRLRLNADVGLQDHEASKGAFA